MNTKNYSLQKSSLLIASLIAGCLTLTGCDSATAANAAESSQNAKEQITIPVEASTAILGNINDYQYANVVLEAPEEASVVAKVNGIIETINVEEGDYVTEGQILASIESKRFELKLQQVAAQVSRLENELTRIKKVHGQKLVATDTYDKLKWQYQETLVSLDIAKLDLAETQIIAPIDGYIAARNVKKGNLVQQYSSSPLFHIVQTKRLHGIVHLPTQEFASVHIGQNADITFNDTRVAANVERISPIVDKESGTFKVVLNIENADGALKVGMFSRARLLKDSHLNTILIPKQAVMTIDNQHTVFVMQDSIANRQSVKIGYTADDYIEIISGISADQQVITAGQNSLKDQAKVHQIESL